MAIVATAAAGTSNVPRRVPLFLLGVGLFVLGPAIYAFQLHAKHLVVPWHVPLLATAGVVCMLASVWQRRGVLRGVGALVFFTVCALEWLLVGIVFKTPAYTGPAQPGRKLPAFQAALANGTPFTERDLEQGTPTVLVFFRGRW